MSRAPGREVEDRARLMAIVRADPLKPNVRPSARVLGGFFCWSRVKPARGSPECRGGLGDAEVGDIRRGMETGDAIAGFTGGLGGVVLGMAVIVVRSRGRTAVR